MLAKLIGISTTFLFLIPTVVLTQNATPVNFKVAFMGDQGLGINSEAVLELISVEGAQAVMHSGDFDYEKDPESWEAQLNAILGEDFPYFITMGEDDANRYFTENGYQDRAEARMNRLGIVWDGDLGTKSSFIYQGILFIQTTPGISAAGQSNHDTYIENMLEADNSLWRISTFHKNQKDMQLCGHNDATGWPVYERSREGGAIVMSGQCHVYARTHLLSDMSNKQIASTGDTLTLASDLGDTEEDEGRTFALVSGLGGRSVHNQQTDGAWWATKYSKKQDATYGALFGVFNYNGVANLAKFYFKNIEGEIIDEFYAKSAVTGDYGVTVSAVGSGTVDVSPELPVFDSGSEVTLTANPSAGWRFGSWSGDFTGTQNPAIVTMDDHKVITATFELREYTLTVDTLGSGNVSVDPTGNIHQHGTVVALTASPLPGFTFSGWSGGAGSDNTLDLTIISDTTLVATFVENDLPVALDDNYSAEEDQVLNVAAPGLLNNDTDPDGDPLQASLVTGPIGGAVALSADGAFSYTPNLNFNGSDFFTYQVHDGKGGRDTATVAITVTPVSDPPVAGDDTFTLPEDDSLSVAPPGVLANDSDPDGDTLIASLNSGVANGTLTLNPDGSFSYVPAADFHGSDSFTYSVVDSLGETSSATVSLTIVHTNDPPVPVADFFSVDEDQILQVLPPGVLANDSDPEADPLTASLQNGPGHGTVFLNPDGSFSYVPNANFNGSDSFTYTASDTAGGGATAEVLLTVNPVDDTPVAAQDNYFAEEFKLLEVTAPGVLANDIEPDGDTLIAELLSGTVHGSLTLSTDGSFNYSADTGFLGTDTFSYRASDSNGGLDSAQVSITVGPNAVTNEETVTGTSNESSVVTTSGPLTAVNGHLYLAAVATKSFAEVSQVAGLGLTWTRLLSQCSGRNNTGVEVWSAQGLPSGNDVVTVTLLESPTNAVLAVSRYSGVDPENAVHNVLSGNTVGVNGTCSGGEDGSIYSFDYTTTFPGSVVYGVLGMRQQGHIPGPGFSERTEVHLGDGGAGAGLATVEMTVESVATTVFTGEFSGDVDWAAGAVEIKAGSTDITPHYSLATSKIGSGSIELVPSGGVYEEGTAVTLRSVASSGWRFTEWTGDASGSDSTLTLQMDGPKSVTATFEEVRFALSLSSAGQGSVATNPSESTYPMDASVTLTAIADSGWAFVGWSGDVSSSSNPLLFTMDGDKSIAANFEENATPVAVDDAFNLAEDDTLVVSKPGVLSNDTDADGDSLTVSLHSAPSFGSLSLSGDGSFSYIPPPDSNGVVTFSYSLNDDRGGSALANVSLTIQAVNDPPVANPESYQISEEDSLMVEAPGVLANDLEVDGESLTLTLLSATQNGSLTLNPDGSFIYLPNPNFSGADSFRYRIADGGSEVDSALVSIEVAAKNDAPVAVEDIYTLNEDDTLAVSAPGLLANDTDADGDALSVSLTAGPANGTASLSADGSLVYSPAANFFGSDTLIYTVDDGGGATALGRVVLNVTSVPDTPVAQNDSFSIEEFKTLNVSAPGVLANDTDGDGDILSATLLAGPANGSLTFNSDGSFGYAANPGFLGADLFTYSANDGQGGSATAEVSITVNPKTVTFEQVVVGSSSDDVEVSTSGPLTAADGDLYLAAISSKSFREVTQVDGLGLVWARVRQQCSGRGNTGVEIWMAIGQPTSDQVITATFDSEPSNAVLAVSRYSGVDTDNPVLTILGGNTNGLNGGCSGGSDNDHYAFTLDVESEGATIFVAAAVRNDEHNPGESYQERAWVFEGGGGAGAGLGLADQAGVASGPTALSGAFSDDVDWAIMGVEIKSSSTGGVIPTYDLSVSVQGSGVAELSPAGGTYEVGTEVTLTASPSAGWNFSGWSGALSGLQNPAPLTMDEDKSVTALFTEIPPPVYDLTVTTAGQGAVQGTPGGQQHVEGTQVTLTASPDPGWVFTGWTGDSTSLSNSLQIHMDSHKNLTANFLENANPTAVNDTYNCTEDDTLVVGTAGVLGNDSDADGDSLTASLVAGPAFGDLAFNADGSFTYIPSADSNGVVTFSYSANDGKGGTGLGTVTLAIAPVNDAPVAEDDAFQLIEDDTLTVTAPGLLANDRDADFDSLTISLLSPPSKGTLDLSGNGAFTYVPNAEFHGTDSFSYSVDDGHGEQASATVHLTISVQNDLPVAIGDDYTVSEDDTLRVPAPGVLANDTDSDNDPLAAVVQNLPANGNLNLNTDGSFLYIPNPNFSGSDGFTYLVTDTSDGTAEATVDLTIAAVADLPVANNDNYNVRTNSSLTISAPGVLANDSDADGDDLTVSLLAAPTQGTLTLNSNGSFNYSPSSGFVGQDSFTYTSHDGTGGSDTATAILNINPADVTHEETVSGASSELAAVSTSIPLNPVSGHLYLAAISSKPFRQATAVTGLGLTWTLVDLQCSGRDNTGVEIWMAQGEASGDGHVLATLSDAPRNALLSVSRYSSVDGENPIGSIVSGNTLGLSGSCSGGDDQTDYSFSFTTTADGSVIFGVTSMRNKSHTPGADYAEHLDLVQGSGGSATALAVVERTVSSPSTVPFEGSFSSDVDWAVMALELRAGTFEVTPQFTLTTTVSGSGSVTLSPPGGIYDEGTQVTATALAETGWSFTGWTGDLAGDNSPASLIMNADKQITATFTENAAPLAATDTYTVNEDDTLVVSAPGVLGNDSDSDGDALSASLLTGPSHGTAAVSADGSFQYVPQANFNGSDSFTYSASDGKGGVANASVSITINPVADAPLAQADAFQVHEGDTLSVAAPGVLTNDSDPDGDALTASLLSGPSNGTLDLNPDGSFVFLPAPNFHGADSFSYTTHDANDSSSTATVTLTVTEVNHLPTAGNDTFTLDEDATLTVSVPGVLANDSDSDGDPLTAATDNQPENGTLSLDADGSFTYTPEPDFFGTDLFTYTVADGRGGSASASVTLTVNPVQDAPQATDDSFSVRAGNNLTVPVPGVLSNDSDSDGDVLQVALLTGPFNGTLSLNADGSFSYEPTSGFSGTDSFAYTLSDGNGGADGADVTISVSAAEVSLEEIITGTSSEANTVATSGPVTGVSGQLYLAAISTKSYRETVAVTGLNLSWSRVDAQCSGRDQNGVEVWMAQGQPSADDPVSAVFDGTAKNAIIAVSRFSDVSASGPIGTVLSGNTVGLEGTCSSGSDGDAYNFDFQTTADGSLIYAAIVMRAKNHFPGTGYEQQVEVLQGSGGAGASLALVDRQVDLTSSVALAGTFSSEVDWAVIGVELHSGSAGSTQPQFSLGIATSGNGTVSRNPAQASYNSGTAVTLTAEPDAGWSFSGWSGDLSGSENPTTVTIDAHKTVTAEFVELPPVEFTLSTQVIGNGVVTVSPTGGQYHAGSTVTVTAQSDSGWVFVSWSGDLGGSTNPGSISMDSDKSVTAQFVQNNPPTAVDDSYNLSEDDTLTVAAEGVLSNDSDPDGDALTVSVASGPSSGDLILNPDGSFVYTPTAHYNGGDVYTYTLSDPKGGSATGTVILNISPVNDEPMTGDDVYTLGVDETLNITSPGLLANDTDPDGDPLTASTVSGPTSGSLALNADGSFTYTPNSGFVGSDGFSYLASDGQGGSAVGNVSLAISSASVTFEGTNSGTSANSIIVSTNTTVSGANGYLYLAAIASKPFKPAVSVSGLGLTWTLVDGQCSGRDKTGIEVWQAQGDVTGDGVVSATLTDAPKNAAIIVSRYSGTDPVDPIGSQISGNSNGLSGGCSGGSESDSYSFALETFTGGEVIYGAAAMRERTHAPGAGYEEREEILIKASGSGSSIAAMDQAFDSAGSQTVSGSFDREVDWAVIALAIRPPAVLSKMSQRNGNALAAQAELPSEFELFQNYPNPFNPSTLIRFNVPTATKITLTVYDLKGRTVATLINESRKAGSYAHTWNAMDAKGRPVASGVYFYRLQAGEFDMSYRMLLVR